MEFISLAIIGALKAISSAFASIWTPFGGILLGFVLTQVAVSLRSWFNERKEKQAVRQILRIEVCYNLETAENIMRAFVLSTRGDDGWSIRTDDIADFLERFPWQRKAFDSLMPKLPLALSKKEVEAVFELYAWYEYISRQFPLKMAKGMVDDQQAIERHLKLGIGEYFRDLCYMLQPLPSFWQTALKPFKLLVKILVTPIPLSPRRP